MIDVDISPDQRELVYDYIINSYPTKQTAFILSFGSVKSLGVIDMIGRVKKIDLNTVAEIKKTFKTNDALLKSKFPVVFDGVSEQFGIGSDAEIKDIIKIARKKECADSDIDAIVSYHQRNTSTLRKSYPDVVKYYDGLYGVPVSQSVHPAGIIVSPDYVDLPKQYGVFTCLDKKTGKNKNVLSIDMECCHEISLVKYDILGLKQVQINRLTCEAAGLPSVILSHQIDWEDETVWKHMLDSPIGVFQFEGNYAYNLLKKFGPHKIDDMTLINAALRPSGESFRDDLLAGKIYKNPSPQIDKLLEGSNGFLCIEGNQIVEMKNGFLPIKEVKVGDYVRTRFGFRKVLEAKKTGHKELLKVYYKNTNFTGFLLQNILMTPEHRVMTKNGWKKACELSVGESIYTHMLGKTYISPVTGIETAPAADVYDLTVEYDHEFVCQGIVVHNCYQEDTIKFLQQICGLSGSEADNIRRAIARKQKERLDAAMPQILSGYCKNSDKPKEVAEKEARDFLKIIQDSASYQFGLVIWLK